ncbi:ATP-binding protein [Myroides phaeus]|uniref:ATP-binding protein n=1 Tax=Myroides phaeus TaxID=702745 RepID=UPI002DBE50A3|nr:ATP-binding protein [Myroides phaeus]MEC4117130.1 ATP-binding protein [Myroides phaeus]
MKGYPFMQNINAFESLRASDFDCYSAYGEIIDNSIQANATDIRMLFTRKEGRKSTHEIGEVCFADNGIGMDKDLLNKCLAFGHSSRYNDRSGIGRFGVGMILGAIHECRRVEVYSKQNGRWLFTYIDLDEIQENSLPAIPEPVVQDPNKLGNKYASFLEFLDDSDSGTFIIWKKYDRYTDKFEIVLDETRFWLGRTFRKFLWGVVPNVEPIEITVNLEKVKAFDPLFYIKEKTGFEKEPVATMLTPSFIDWEVSKDANVDMSTSKITIDVSILPNEYLQRRGDGGNNFAKDRKIDRNEGLSILRNYREVFSGHMPYSNKLNGSEAERNISRFIGCEINFMPELDAAFEVKNIKRGCVPGKLLKDEIIEKLTPTFRTQRDNIKEYWDELDLKLKDNVGEQEKELGLHTGHSETNNALKSNKDLTKDSKIKKTEKDNERIAELVNEEIINNPQMMSDLIDYLKDQGFIVLEKAMPGSVFISFEHGNGIKTMIYNTNSPFYKSYKSLLESIEVKNKENAVPFKTLVDFIFVCYMLAESKIDPNAKYEGVDVIDEIKNGWALQLNKFFKRVWEK